MPPQQNLWVHFGSDRIPITWNNADSVPCGVRKPYAFLVVSFALQLNPTTNPDTKPRKARNQLSIRVSAHQSHGARFASKC